jgi:2-dehydropantoate 2-reductase
MRVCIVGCGAIGSLFAAYLAQRDDVEVWAYDLDQAHVDAINATGLRLSGEGNVHSHPRASTNPADIPACDFGIVATKTLHTRAAIQATAGIFPDGAVCSVQNGVGNEEIIAEYVPRVIRGTTFPAGRIIAPGHVQQDTGGKTWMGPFEPKSASM